MTKARKRLRTQHQSVDERSARRAVNRLACLGILAQRSAERRNRVFECAEMMDAFTEAARQQPAASLPFLAARTAADRQDALGVCGALTRKKTRCRHSQPALGSRCRTGHLRAD